MWPVKKPDGSWRMTIDYQELNKVTPPRNAIVPSIHNLMDQLTTKPGTYHYVLDLANAFFSVELAPESQDQFAFTWEGRRCTLTVLPQGYLHSPTICHGLVAQDLATWTQLATVELFYYIDVMLTSTSLTDLGQAAPAPLQHLKTCGWAVNATQGSGTWLICRILGCCLVG